MNVPLEGAPTDDQKHRLTDWLAELLMICRNYALVLDTDDGETRVIDLNSGTVIGLGLTYLGDEEGRLTAYDCTGSILDGVWLVDTDTGLREQRDVGPVLPAPRHRLP